MSGGKPVVLKNVTSVFANCFKILKDTVIATSDNLTFDVVSPNALRFFVGGGLLFLELILAMIFFVLSLIAYNFDNIILSVFSFGCSSAFIGSIITIKIYRGNKN